jgi:hypothetical protein
MSKYEYFKFISGLSGTPSLRDCEAAYFGPAGGPLPFYRAANSSAAGSLRDNELIYLQTQTGKTGTLADLRSLLYAAMSAAVTAGVSPAALIARRSTPVRVKGVSVSITVTPDASIQLGDWMIAVFTGTTPTASIAPPAGWTVLRPYSVVGTLITAVFGKNRVAGETGYSFTPDSGVANAAVDLIWGGGGRPVSEWVVGALTNRAVDFTNKAVSITTTVDHTLAIVISTERTSATETDVTSVTGATEFFFGVQSGTNLQTTLLAEINKSPAGATGDVTIVYPNTQAINGQALQIGIPPYIGKISDIATWAAQPLAYIAHRGGSGNWPEMTKFAYDQSVLWGMTAVEISVWRSSDGTFIASHDQNLSRVTGTSLDIPTSTAAAATALNVTATGTNNTGQPVRAVAKLSDILAAYGDNVVIFIEDKSYANQAALITYLQTFPHWAERFIWKQSGTGTKYAIPATMKSWGYFFDADMASFAAKQAQWTYVGLDYLSTDATLNSAIATAGASRVIGHILPSLASSTRLQGLGVKKFMVANVTDVVPAS